MKTFILCMLVLLTAFFAACEVSTPVSDPDNDVEQFINYTGDENEIYKVFKDKNGIYYARVFVEGKTNFEKEGKEYVEIIEDQSHSFYNKLPANFIIPQNETITYDWKTYEIYGIHSYAFENCSSLKRIEICNPVDHIAHYAFKNSGVEELTIGNSVRGIGEGAYSGCSRLKTVTLGLNVSGFGESPFADCPNFTTLNFNCRRLSVPDVFRPKAYPIFPSSITTLNIGKEVEIIPSYIFFNLNQLKTVTIPASVKEIGSYAFGECESIASIRFESSIPPNNDRGADYYPHVANHFLIGMTPDYKYYYCYVDQNEGLRPAVIYVPKGSRNAYRNSPFMRNIWNEIIEE